MKNSFNKEGFTLVELLVVIAIISILSTIAITSLSNSKRKAKDAAFRSISRSVTSGAMVCCADSFVGSLNNVLGADICNPVMGANYPNSYSIGSVEVVRDCDYEDGFQLKLTPGAENEGGSINYALCDKNNCEFF